MHIHFSLDEWCEEYDEQEVFSSLRDDGRLKDVMALKSIGNKGWGCLECMTASKRRFALHAHGYTDRDLEGRAGRAVPGGLPTYEEFKEEDIFL